MTLTNATLGLLGAAIMAAWWPRPRWLWLALLALALAVGLSAGVFKPVALAAVAVLSGLGWRAMQAPSSPWWALPAPMALGLAALAMALHVLPGFQRIPVFEAAQLSPDAPPFSLFASSDKAIAGLIMLACVCRRCQTWGEAAKVGRTAAWVGLVTGVCVLGVGWLAHAVRLDPKWPAQTLAFLGVNLLFTCVAEEAFFRGLLQERLMQTWQTRPAWLAMGVPVLLSAVLFGAVHLGGGLPFAALATLAGLGYAGAYAVTRRIEAAVLVHFGLNAAHFLMFTYPRLAT